MKKQERNYYRDYNILQNRIRQEKERQSQKKYKKGHFLRNVSLFCWKNTGKVGKEEKLEIEISGISLTDPEYSAIIPFNLL